MTNKFNAATQKMSGLLAKTPLFSIFTAAAAPVAVAIISTPFDVTNTMWPLVAVALVSPAVCGVAAIVGVMNILREHSTLSKMFSGVAAAAGATGVIGMLAYMGTPDYGPLNGFVLSVAGMTAAGAMNTAAHYTRNFRRKGADDSIPPPPP